MADLSKLPSELPVRQGGSIPGSGGLAAWVLRDQPASPVPVLIAVPHAGRCYTPALLQDMRNPAYAALRLEDRYADLLGEAVAAATGAALLVADAPRAMIDLNRAVDDVDWGMVSPSGAGPSAAGQPSPVALATGHRARGGLGLVPRRVPGIGEIWKRSLDRQDLADRIAGVYDPYHRQLATSLMAIRQRWGAALLLDLHSMPPLAAKSGGRGPSFVLGDRFGAACDSGLMAAAFAHFASAGQRAAHNRPYAGGYGLERHAAPRRNLHAIQIEVDRAQYLDSRLAEPGAGFATVVATLVGLVRCLAREVAARGAAEWAGAAEAAE